MKLDITAFLWWSYLVLVILTMFPRIMTENTDFLLMIILQPSHTFLLTFSRSPWQDSNKSLQELVTVPKLIEQVRSSQS